MVRRATGLHTARRGRRLTLSPLRCYNNVTCYARAQGAATLASSKAWDKATRVRDARSVAHAATRG